MSFGINKNATMVIKPLNFVNYPGYEDLQIFPIVGFLASLQIKCFIKWKNSKCIIWI